MDYDSEHNIQSLGARGITLPYPIYAKNVAGRLKSLGVK
jgi:hypothetical protein